MNDYNVVEQRNNKSPTHFEKEPYIRYIRYIICQMKENSLTSKSYSDRFRGDNNKCQYFSQSRFAKLNIENRYNEANNSISMQRYCQKFYEKYFPFIERTLHYELTTLICKQCRVDSVNRKKGG